MAKGQESMEYMMLFGFSLLIVVVLWSVSSSNMKDTQWELQLAYAKNAIESIVQTADREYIEGPPAQVYISVDFPENVNAVYIQDNAVAIELKWKGILRNVTAYSIANLTGYIGSAPGKHRILVSAGPVVNISEA